MSHPGEIEEMNDPPDRVDGSEMSTSTSALPGESLPKNSKLKRRHSSVPMENNSSKRLQADTEYNGYEHTRAKEPATNNSPSNRSQHENIVYIEFPHITLARVNAVDTRQELESRFGELKITAVGLC